MKKGRIILADDHGVFAEELEVLLQDEFQVIGTALDSSALLEAVQHSEPDLVITDVSMRSSSGIECLRKLRETVPEVKVLLMTMHDDAGLAASAMKLGAAGYVLKNSGTKELLRAVREAIRGGAPVSPRIATSVERAGVSAEERGSQLTPRQMEILGLLVDGLSAREIAARVNLTPRTVEFHKSQAMERIGVSSSDELIAYGRKRGIRPV